MAHEFPRPGGPWSLPARSLAADTAAIDAVRDRLIQACSRQTPPPQHHRSTGDLMVPEAVLVLLESHTHRTESVEELDTPASRDLLRTVIGATEDSLREGRIDITGGLARIWCASEDPEDARTAPPARVQSIHLVKAGPSWKVTAVVATTPEGGLDGR